MSDFQKELEPLRPLDFESVPVPAEMPSDNTPVLRATTSYTMKCLVPGVLNTNGQPDSHDVAIDVCLSTRGNVPTDKYTELKDELKLQVQVDTQQESALTEPSSIISDSDNGDLPLPLILIEIGVNKEYHPLMDSQRLDILIDPTIYSNVGHEYRFRDARGAVNITVREGSLEVEHGHHKKHVEVEDKFDIERGESLRLWAVREKCKYAIKGTGLRLAFETPFDLTDLRVEAKKPNR